MKDRKNIFKRLIIGLLSDSYQNDPSAEYQMTQLVKYVLNNYGKNTGSIRDMSPYNPREVFNDYCEQKNLRITRVDILREVE